MPRLLAAAMLAMLLPSPAFAQVAIPDRVGVPNATNHGITVSGSATARIPATSAHLTLSVMTADRKLSLDRASLQPIVDAIEKAGADPGSVQLPPSFSAPGYSNNAAIAATFSKPTLAEMQSGIISVGSVIAAQNDLVLTNAQVQLTAADCTSALDGLRHEAVRQAHAKAVSLASDLGVHLGPAINANIYDQLAADGSCSSEYYINGFGGFNPSSPQKPDDYVSVLVHSTVSVTYAIK